MADKTVALARAIRRVERKINDARDELDELKRKARAHKGGSSKRRRADADDDEEDEEDEEIDDDL
jgi:hypothetical protein